MGKAKVVVVNKDDKVIGADHKKAVLEKGLIHRIVRVLLFNSKGQVFLQKRSANKYSWPNRWDQSVGGYVDEGEDYDEAVKRETKEELGIDGVRLAKVVKYYTEGSSEGKMKRRFNMLYEGTCDKKLKPREEEISEGDWFDMSYVEKWMKDKPNDFTPGCIKTFREYRKKRLS